MSVLLFTGLDGRRRAMRMAIVDRIEEVPASAVERVAGQMRVVIGERILPLAGAVDASVTGEEEAIRLFRMNDGVSELGYAFREVIDIKTMDGDLIAASQPGEIEGVTLIDGVTGFICDDVDQMVDAVSRLHLIERDECRRQGLAFSADAMARRYERVYESVAQPERAAPLSAAHQ